MSKLTAKMIGDQINAKLKENSEEVNETVDIKLDPDDTARLENVLLKQTVEALTKQLEDKRRQEASQSIQKTREDYQMYLAEKYDVDLDTFNIAVDATRYVLQVTPRPSADE